MESNALSISMIMAPSLIKLPNYLNGRILEIKSWYFSGCRACARLVLGVEFHRLQETEEPRASFKTQIDTACQQLSGLRAGQLLAILDWLIANYWSNPTLVAMMKGDVMEQERGELNSFFCLSCLFYFPFFNTSQDNVPKVTGPTK